MTAREPREDNLARLPGADISPSPSLPDLKGLPEVELLEALRAGDALAFTEAYQRTVPAAHAVVRRLLGTVQVEAVLCALYTELWASSPEDQPLGVWARSRSFDLAAADLRRRAIAPASPSAALLLRDLPEPSTAYLGKVESVLARLPKPQRRALCLAHDRGIATHRQTRDAAVALDRALLALAEVPYTRDQVAPTFRLGDYVLDLLPTEEAADITAAARADEGLSARIDHLRRGRLRIQGLMASPAVGHRIVAQVLTAHLPRAAASAATSTPLAADSDRQTVHVEPTPAPDDATPAAPHPGPATITKLAADARSRGTKKASTLLIAAALLLITAANAMMFGSRPTASADVRPAVAATQPAPVAARATATHAQLRSAIPRSAPRRVVASKPDSPRIVPPRAVKPIAPPVHIAVPAIGVKKRLVELGVEADGTLASPVDFNDPGWYRDGVSPGERGPAVIVGHVDSLTGPAVFYELKSLRRGDKVAVKRADGTTARFVIDRVATFPKENFPTQQVYGDTARPELRLITCGGAFNNTTRHYDDNVIAFGHMVRPARPTPKVADEAPAKAAGAKRPQKGQKGGRERPKDTATAPTSRASTS